METGMKDKKVLITGSTKGIGRGCADIFANEGSYVIVHGRDQQKCDEVAADVWKKYPHAKKVIGIAADLRKVEDIENLYKKATEDGPIDVLVNNAGVYPTAEGKIKSFLELTDEDWDALWVTDMMSAVRLSRLAFKDMMDRNYGKIIMVTSEAALRSNKDVIAYGAVKSAMTGLARGMAEATKGTCVTVNSVLPVTTITEGHIGYLESYAKTRGLTGGVEEAKKDYFINGNDAPSLIGRFTTVEECAMTVLFVAANDGVNGNSVLIDGGVIRHI